MAILKTPKQFLQVYGSFLILLGLLSFFGLATMPIGTGDLTDAPWYVTHYRTLFRLGLGIIVLLLAHSSSTKLHRILTSIVGIYFALNTLGGVWTLFYYYTFHPTDLPHIPGWTISQDWAWTTVNLVLTLLAFLALKRKDNQPT